jgi:hypothetical protein
MIEIIQLLKMLKRFIVIKLLSIRGSIPINLSSSDSFSFNLNLRSKHAQRRCEYVHSVNRCSADCLGLFDRSQCCCWRLPPYFASFCFCFCSVVTGYKSHFLIKSLSGSLCITFTIPCCHPLLYNTLSVNQAAYRTETKLICTKRRFVLY